MLCAWQFFYYPYETVFISFLHWYHTKASFFHVSIICVQLRRAGVNPVWSFDSKRLIFIVLWNDLISLIYNAYILKAAYCLVVLEIRVILWRTFVSILLQHYSGTTRITEIQLCLRAHRQVGSDKIPSIAVKKQYYDMWWEMKNFTFHCFCHKVM